MSWPRAILHLDADAFFASVEQSIDPALAGQPVVTGRERNIVSAASYEARARGITRGVALWEIPRLCPECLILPSDYETYSLFSLRLFSLLRRYTAIVEEFSVDEAFADLTGTARLHRRSYAAIASEIQATAKRELGLSVSVGVSLTRTLAKLASQYRKPGGLTLVDAHQVPRFLAMLPVSEVCGIGPSATALLVQRGVTTAAQLAALSGEEARRLLGKTGHEIWRELNGETAIAFATDPWTPRCSIMKSKTFTPPRQDRDFVRAQLFRNLESASLKARRHAVAAGALHVFLRHQGAASQARDSHLLFAHRGDSARLTRPTNLPADLIPVADRLFARLFRPDEHYRATGVVLAELAPDEEVQYSLFDEVECVEKNRTLQSAVDGLAERFGKHVVAAGTGLHLKRQHETSRAQLPARRLNLLPGETARRRLGVPLWRIPI